MKYSKKIKKHFAFISQQSYLQPQKDALTTIKNLSALLEGACCHFFTDEKPNELVFKIKKAFPPLFSEQICADEDDFINLYGNVLLCLCAYKNTTCEKDADEDIKKVANFLLGALASKSEELTCYYSANFAKTLSAVNGLVEYYAISKDKNALILLDKISNDIKNLNVNKSSGLCLDYLSLCLGLVKYAQILNKTAVNDTIGALFDNFMVRAQSLNYASSLSFENKNQTDAGATAKSLEVTLGLFNNTKDPRYLSLARRIWFNGLQFCQRADGQVGSDTFTDEKTTLKVKTYEEKQISTPLFGTCLKCYASNKTLFDEWGDLVKDRKGRYFIGDKMFARDVSGFFGKDLIEIPTLTAFDKETAMQLEFKLIF